MPIVHRILLIRYVRWGLVDNYRSPLGHDLTRPRRVVSIERASLLNEDVCRPALQRKRASLKERVTSIRIPRLE